MFVSKFQESCADNMQEQSCVLSDTEVAENSLPLEQSGWKFFLYAILEFNLSYSKNLLQKQVNIKNSLPYKTHFSLC